MIFSVYDGNTLLRSYTSEATALSFADDKYSVVPNELYTSNTSDDKSIQNIDALSGMGEGLSCALYGAGPSGATIPQPKVDVVLAANARWDIPYLDYNLYTDLRYSQWLNAGKIKLNSNVQYIASEGLTPASYWFVPRSPNYGHSGKSLLYLADKICRFSKIYLLGFDYTLGPNRELHANEPDGLCNNGNDDCSEHENRIFQVMLSQFDSVRWTDGKVWNLNRNSALTMFPFL